MSPAHHLMRVARRLQRVLREAVPRLRQSTLNVSSRTNLEINLQIGQSGESRATARQQVTAIDQRPAETLSPRKEGEL